MFIVYNPCLYEIVEKYTSVNFSYNLKTKSKIVVDDVNFIKLISDTQQAVDNLKSTLLGSNSCKDIDRHLVLNVDPNFIKNNATTEFYNNNFFIIEDLCKLHETLNLKNVKYVKFCPFA